VGIIPARYLNTPVDFDELTSLGSMMGSGSIIVIDEDTCAVDLARYFVDFLCSESCGKCLPCREGLKRMREILDSIESGQGDGDGYPDPAGDCRIDENGIALRPGTNGSQSGPEHYSLFPRGV